MMDVVSSSRVTIIFVELIITGDFLSLIQCPAGAYWFWEDAFSVLQ